MNTPYTAPAELLSTIETKNIDGKTDQFSILHTNIRSISKNLPILCEMLSSAKFSPSLIAITETWTTISNQDDFKMQGYESFFKSRTHSTGGGVGFFINQNMNYIVRPDLDCPSPDIAESLFIELPAVKSIIGCIYRPPGAALQPFIDYLDTTLQEINNGKYKGFLAGDFNIDLLRHDNHTITNDFIECLFSHCFFPTIFRPTRITEFSATLIDNILTNSINNELKTAIIYAEISDHLPIILKINHPSRRGPSGPSCENRPQRRSYTNPNITKFINELQTMDWPTIISPATNLNEAYDLFNSNFCDIFNDAFPTQVIRPNDKRSPRKAWITPGLARACKKKEKLYIKFIKSRSPKHKHTYTIYRNKLISILKKAEKAYYSQVLADSKCNMKLKWNTLKSILGLGQNSRLTDYFNIDNQCITDPTTIATTFNDFFTNIGPSLANNIPSASTDDIANYLSNPLKDSFFISPTTPDEVIQITNSCKSKSSFGIDQIPMTILKQAVPYIADVLSDLFNWSFSDGIFPQSMKLAVVTPIFKNGDPHDVTNYRPISILPNFSKILEKLVNIRLNAHINKHNILYHNQYGFRSNLDTSLAVTELVDQISASLDNKELSLGIFIDLSKAFDTLDHTILLSKLPHYGIRGIALSWFRSYLTARQQQVKIGSFHSKPLTITCGVPQGSILGPTLFLLYINDVYKSSPHAHFILYADDSNLFFRHKNLAELIRLATAELSNIYNWFRINKLSVNLKKSHFIVFSIKSPKHVILPDNITTEKYTISRTNKTKFLGIIIQDNLSWTSHICEISKKISKTIGILYRGRHKLSPSHLKLLYNSLVLPYLTYCNLAWGNSTLTEINKLLLLQKKVIRIISNSSYAAHTNPLFHDYELLKAQDINQFQSAVFMFKIKHKLLPPHFLAYFKNCSDAHSYQTRNAHDNFYVNSRHTKLRSSTIRFHGPKVWNALSIDLKNICSLPRFKSAIYNNLIGSYLLL